MCKDFAGLTRGGVGERQVLEEGPVSVEKELRRRSQLGKMGRCGAGAGTVTVFQLKRGNE